MDPLCTLSHRVCPWQFSLTAVINTGSGEGPEVTVDVLCSGSLLSYQTPTLTRGPSFLLLLNAYSGARLLDLLSSAKEAFPFWALSPVSP